MSDLDQLEKFKKEFKTFGKGKIILKFINDLQRYEENDYALECDDYGDDDVTEDEITEFAARCTLRDFIYLGEKADKFLK